MSCIQGNNERATAICNTTERKARYQHWQILFDYPEQKPALNGGTIYAIKQINAFMHCFNCYNLNKVFNFICGDQKVTS